eukprot:1116231-Amorphochlora_amoeboformis.AAC.1
MRTRGGEKREKYVREREKREETSAETGGERLERERGREGWRDIQKTERMIRIKGWVLTGKGESFVCLGEF